MDIVQDISRLRGLIGESRNRGLPVGFVPTMGNLHAGHLSMVEEVRRRGEFAVVSIFVNPFQFGPGEDYDSYPRTLDEDAEKLRRVGADLLFTPGVGDLYPEGLDRVTRVEVPEMGKTLCGQSRPTFFRGVTTVVSILLHLVGPDYALFGEKDYQQLLIIRRMVSDLKMPITIVPFPTVREEDGLAMSSRNRYLTFDERQRAPMLYRTLRAMGDSLAAGGSDHAAIRADGMDALTSAGFIPDYLEIRRATDLTPPEPGDRNLRILGAAWLGKARLIDNVGV
uniref:Pantothenate synthetase n=1 Tax=Candidatus Kentrum sp. DK TaxID=2126562 RepID=A0A450T384_9GAMM|nr:MAG: pantothenate synthetase [Candidatus Kentron sp. DK]